MDGDGDTSGPAHAYATTAAIDPLDEVLRGVAGAPPIAPPVLALGTVLGGAYRVDRALGKGGMGVVYLAHDLRLHRDVAIKLHLDRLDEAGAARMSWEAKVMARLSHPHVITVYEVGTYQHTTFIVMEYVDGGTLRGWLRGARRSWREIVDTFLRAGQGLAAAHDAGLVHRDFKPDNVLVGDDGRIRVADFGLARAAIDPAPAIGAAAPEGASARAGTPAYMAPEQRRGAAVDARADQYSFCVALAEALEGKRGVPRAVRAATARGLADDPERRHPSMGALLRQLRRAVTARRRAAIGAAAMIAVAAAGVATWSLRRPPVDHCTGGADRLASTWSLARRARLGAALAADGVDAAPVLASLDRYARSWVGMYRDACVATSRHEQSDRLLDVRIVCLDRLRAQLDAGAGVLERSDRDGVAEAVRAIDKLPRLALCGDIAALGAVTPLPTEPAHRAAIDAIIVETGRIAALTAAGRYGDARDPSTALATVGRAESYQPARALALFTAAETHVELPELIGQAEQEYDEAITAALGGGEDRIAAMALASLAFQLAPVRADEARRAANQAEAIAEHVGGADLVAPVLTDVGEVARVIGDLDHALRNARRAVALLRTIDLPAWHLGHALVDQGLVEHALGHEDDARASLDEAVAILARSLGDDHPDTIGALLARADVALRSGRIDDAERDVTRAVETAHRRAGTPGESHEADAWRAVSRVREARGDHAAALDALQHGIALADQVPAAARGYRGEDLGNLAIISVELGDLDAGADAARRSLDDFTARYGAGTSNLVQPSTLCGTIERLRGHVAESERVLATAVALADAQLPADHPQRLNVHVELAKTLLALGRATAAAAELEPVVAALAQPAVDAPDSLAEARFTLAQAVRAADPARARALATQARDGYAAIGFDEPRAEIDAWLAR